MPLRTKMRIHFISIKTPELMLIGMGSVPERANAPACRRWMLSARVHDLFVEERLIVADIGAQPIHIELVGFFSRGRS